MMVMMLFLLGIIVLSIKINMDGWVDNCDMRNNDMIEDDSG